MILNDYFHIYDSYTFYRACGGFFTRINAKNCCCNFIQKYAFSLCKAVDFWYMIVVYDVNARIEYRKIRNKSRSEL